MTWHGACPSCGEFVEGDWCSQCQQHIEEIDDTEGVDTDQYPLDPDDIVVPRLR